MAHPVAEKYRQALERLSDGDTSAFADALAPDVVWHEAGNPQVIRGKDAVLERMSAMPGDEAPRVTLRSVLGDDEHLAVFGHAEFRRAGERCEYDFVELMTHGNALVTERWSYMDAVPDDVARFFAGG